jgi:hypothetical protein
VSSGLQVGPAENTPAQSQKQTGCNQVLPNGNTVGNDVRQSQAELQASYDNAAQTLDVDPAMSLLGTFLAIASPSGPIDYKNNFAGSGSPASLGRAGNFAYYSSGSSYLPNGVLDLGAGAYALKAALSGQKPFASLTGPKFSDASAASVRGGALASGGCP